MSAPSLADVLAAALAEDDARQDAWTLHRYGRVTCRRHRGWLDECPPGEAVHLSVGRWDRARAATAREAAEAGRPIPEHAAEHRGIKYRVPPA